MWSVPRTAAPRPEHSEPPADAAKSSEMWAPWQVPWMQDWILGFYEPVREMTLAPVQRRLVDQIDARLDGRWGQSLRMARDEVTRRPQDAWQRRMLVMTAVWAHRPQLAVQEFQKIEWDPLCPGAVKYVATSETPE